MTQPVYVVEIHEKKADGTKAKVYENEIPMSIGDVREVTRQINAIVQSARK